jgi:hypothetical protein
MERRLGKVTSPGAAWFLAIRNCLVLHNWSDHIRMPMTNIPGILKDAAMDEGQSPEDLAFRDEVRAFLVV